MPTDVVSSSNAVERPRLDGDLRAMSLDDLLLWIATRRKTGTLRVERGPVRKLLVFEEGALLYCSSTDPREKLGQLLLRRGLIGETQLRVALRCQDNNGIQLGLLLVAEGAISAEQLLTTLRAKAEQIAGELFLWSDGTFLFEAGAASVPLRANLDTLALIRQGERLRARALQIRDAFASDRIIFETLRPLEPSEDPLPAALVELAGASRSLRQMVREAHASEFQTADCLLSLCEQGVLRVAGGR